MCARVRALSVCIGQTVGLIPWAGCLVPTLGLRREHQGPQGCSLEGGRAEVPPCGCRAPPPPPTQASRPHGAGHDRHTSGTGALALFAPQSSSVHMSKTPGARRATRVTSAAQTGSWAGTGRRARLTSTPQPVTLRPRGSVSSSGGISYAGACDSQGSSPAPSLGNLSSFVRGCVPWAWVGSPGTRLRPRQARRPCSAQKTQLLFFLTGVPHPRLFPPAWPRSHVQKKVGPPGGGRE